MTQNNALLEKLLAVLVTLFIPWSLWTFLGAPLWSDALLHHDYVASHTLQLKKLNEISSRTAVLTQELSAFDDTSFSEHFLGSEETPALAGAALQTRLRSLVEKNGGRVQSLQIRPTATKGGLVHTPISVSLSANIAEFQSLLLDIENAKPFVRISSLTVRSQPQAWISNTEQIGKLNITFIAVGSMAEAKS